MVPAPTQAVNDQPGIEVSKSLDAGDANLVGRAQASLGEASRRKVNREKRAGGRGKLQGRFWVSHEFETADVGELVKFGDGELNLLEARQSVGMPLRKSCRVPVYSSKAEAAVGQGEAASPLSHHGDGCSSPCGEVGCEKASQPGADDHQIVHRPSNPSKSW